MPLYRQSGEYFGVLCSLDTEPPDLSEKHRATFKLMASLIAHELEAEEQRTELDEALKLSYLANESRARFLSILSHDLQHHRDGGEPAAKRQTRCRKERADGEQHPADFTPDELSD